MKILERLKRLLPGCDAEKLLEKNAQLSEELRGEFADTVGSITTILNRRHEPPGAAPMERRRAAAR